MKYISKILVSAILSTSFMLSGCSNKSSSEVIPDQVSSYQFNKMTCKELEGEIDYLQGAAISAARIVDDRKETQDGKLAAGFLLFWPAMLITDSNKAEANKYAQLKGQYEAAMRSHRRKDCK